MIWVLQGLSFMGRLRVHGRDGIIWWKFVGDIGNIIVDMMLIWDSCIIALITISSFLEFVICT
jgi:hypothetical protein